MLGVLDGVCARMCACVRVWEWGACKCVSGYVCGWVGGYGWICVIVSMQEHALFGMLTISLHVSLPATVRLRAVLAQQQRRLLRLPAGPLCPGIVYPHTPPPLAAPNLPRNVGLRARHRHILSLDHVPSTDPTVY